MDVTASPIEALVLAIVAGEVVAVQELLAEDPGLATRRIEGNPRSMLHYATDWPGHYPRVGDTIRLLIAAGADPNATAQHPHDSAVAETPLHWAASSNDVEAAEVLLELGADVNAIGGIFARCTPFEEAIIFNQLAVARVLLGAGAQNYLAGAAALGNMDQVMSFFDEAGALDLEAMRLANWTSLPRTQDALDRAFQFACRSGHLEIARFVLDRGADPLAVSPGTDTALDMARQHDQPHIIEWLDTL